ncbi:MAG: hypothetical protein H6522_04975 [Mycolicibacterium sp.]|nr:hypothetical protein [Mycolicibacterium sp.]
MAALTALATNWRSASRDRRPDRRRRTAADPRIAGVRVPITLLCYLSFETAIAETIAPRLPDLTVDDPRPRMIGALAMAAFRISLDDWLRDGGSLPDRISRAVTCMTLSPT